MGKPCLETCERPSRLGADTGGKGVARDPGEDLGPDERNESRVCAHQRVGDGRGLEVVLGTACLFGQQVRERLGVPGHYFTFTVL